MKPICFMIMPYGKKATQAEAGQGVATIDFNALWDHAYAPVIKELGYDPIRADQDIGALIITQMIERLYFADLVLAEMTIPNGNVYYEVGVRHAAREKGCVLLAADWSKQLFDVAQMRAIRYPLSDGDVGEAAAQAIREAIKPKIEALAKGGSPVFESIKGYPSDVDEADASTMKGSWPTSLRSRGKSARSARGPSPSGCRRRKPWRTKPASRRRRLDRARRHPALKGFGRHRGRLDVAHRFRSPTAGRHREPGGGPGDECLRPSQRR